MKEKLVKLAVTVLAKNHTPNDKRVQEYHMGELMKAKRVLKENLCNLFTMLMSLCDSDMKNRIERSTEYAEVEVELDSLRLLTMIKKLVFASTSVTTRLWLI